MNPVTAHLRDDRDALGSLPDYLKDNYYWAYLHPENVRRLDRKWIVNFILWGNAQRLMDEALVEMSAGERVLQLGSVYGDFSALVSGRLGDAGHLDVVDVSNLQVSNCRRKLAHVRNAEVWLGDATSFHKGDYDLVCCFFLLHELPAAQRRMTINNALANLKPGGKLVIVDYHRSHFMHPLRPVMYMIFKLLEPFALGLTYEKIPDLIDASSDYECTEQHYFGGLYQKVVVRPVVAR